ncbi:basic proline-rich protein [Diplodia corticola]|uniref:Basic proline-rich protein n=1 Tax=Diplodia corticola TaxID=236234 RepID=A0A1J9QYY5_9PEZI|nr:basic proline-rich protein [Diplodia corticola]OJD33202.1 basic proline-rich protein [Diplodia corticola]
MNETAPQPCDRPFVGRNQAKSAPPVPDSTIQSLKELRLEEKDRLEELPQMRSSRPETPRRCTDPSPSSLLSPHMSPQTRNRSSYARPHLRSTSLSAPIMTRAHSSPTPMSPTSTMNSAAIPRPSSPMRSPARVRASLKFDESYPPSSAPAVSDIGIISEEQELDFAPRRSLDGPAAITMHAGNTFGRQRRRPMSPLHSTNSPFSGSSPSTPSQPSPTLSATKFNEPFPAAYPSSHSSSSVPSTPTSMRSRSPSISSLETIEDSPDAEEAAIEADKIARMEAAAKAAERGGDGMRRSSLDVPRARPMGFSMNSRDKRKRWSVCGAEKRGDLDLETIWED